MDTINPWCQGQGVPRYNLERDIDYLLEFSRQTVWSFKKFKYQKYISIERKPQSLTNGHSV